MESAWRVAHKRGIVLSWICSERSPSYTLPRSRVSKPPSSHSKYHSKLPLQQPTAKTLLIIAHLMKRTTMAVKLARRDVLITMSLRPPNLPSNPPPRVPDASMAMHAAQLTVQYLVPQAPLNSAQNLPALHKTVLQCSVYYVVIWKIHNLCNVLVL